MGGSSSAQPVLSESESERFGLRVGRLTVDSVDGMQLAEHAVRDGMFALVIARVLTADVWAGAPGVEVIDCGTLVTYEGRLGRRAADGSADTGVAALRRIEHWGSAESALVETIFAGYRNHVAANPRLDASVVAAGYADWSARHVDGRVPGECFVLEDDQGAALAFAAVAPTFEALVINLAGVLPAHRGHGVYQHLLDEIEDFAYAQGLRSVRIATQTENAAAIRAWERRGWRQVAQERTVHVMSDGRDGRI